MTMQVMSLPDGLRRFALADLSREPWRNGKGWTRPVAQAGQPDQPVWRVSLAEITQGAPFSRFEGLDRIAVLAAGGPVTLHGEGRDWPLRMPGDRACFPGELALANTAPEREALIWNVMTRRGQARAEVDTHGEGTVSLDADVDTLIWVVSGRYALRDAQGRELCLLGEAEGLHRPPVSKPAATLTLVAATPDAALIRTRLA